MVEVLVGLDESAREGPAPEERWLAALDEEYPQVVVDDREHDDVNGYRDTRVVVGVVANQRIFSRIRQSHGHLLKY